MQQIAEVLRTRPEQAMSAMTSAVERMKRLEFEMEAAFAEYRHAQGLCREQGLTCDYEMQPCMAAGFSEFKMRLARVEARELVP